MPGKVVPLTEQFPTQPQDKVTTYDQSSLWSISGVNGQRYNPDELIGKRGCTIYGKMLVDEQVKAVTEFKLSAILARGWQFTYDDDSELDEEAQKERIAVYSRAIKKMKGSFSDALDAIGSGRDYGFSMTEKVYGTLRVKGKDYKGINRLLTRDPNTFEFYTDDYGTLTVVKQKVNRGLEIEINMDRMIHYVHRPKWDLVYGRSDLRAAYRSWYAKDQLIKMWLLFMEKFAGGIAVATRVGDEAPISNTTEFTSLQNALQNMASLRSLILPKGVELEIHFPATTDQFQNSIVFHDLAIAKALLVPNLLGLSHTGQTGSFSQSQTQFEAFFWTLSTDAQRIEETLNEQLFNDLGDQNWGDGEYPSFSFKPTSLEHAKFMLESWKSLLGAKAVIPTEEDERFLRKLLEFPARDDESKPLVQPAEQVAQDLEQQKVDQTGKILDQKQQQKGVDDKAANEDKFAAAIDAAMDQITELRTQIMVMLSREPAAPVAPNITVHSHQPGEKKEADDEENDGTTNVHFHGAIYNFRPLQLERAAQRVAFAVIDKRTTEVSAFAADGLANLMARAVKKALGNNEQMMEFLDSDTADIANFSFNATDMGKIKAACRQLVDRSWSLGQQHASTELQNAMGDSFFDKATMTVRLASLRDRASAYFDTQSFRMAGDASDQARKIIQQELQNGVKFGTALPQVRANIWNRLVSKGLTKRDIAKGVETDDAVSSVLDELWADNEEQALSYLDTLVRTNTFEALNEARYAEFTDPALKDFVVGLQYASIMDETTSDICEEMDDLIFSADSDVWDTYRPPNHFNCRSILIPVTTLDGWDGDDSELPDVEPQEGFK